MYGNQSNYEHRILSENQFAQKARRLVTEILVYTKNKGRDVGHKTGFIEDVKHLFQFADKIHPIVEYSLREQDTKRLEKTDIVLVFKDECKKDPLNYRPASLTSVKCSRDALW